MNTGLILNGFKTLYSCGIYLWFVMAKSLQQQITAGWTRVTADAKVQPKLRNVKRRVIDMCCMNCIIIS